MDLPQLLRCAACLLGWTLDSLPPLLVLTRRAEPSPRIGWFSHADPPAGVDIERDADELTRCRIVVGDDVWPLHHAARLGITTIVLLPPTADWLWGPRPGPSPWYQSAEVLPADDTAALESRLAAS